MGVYNEESVQTELTKLNVGWGIIAGTTLTRVFKFDDFKSALKFVNQVGDLAEKMQHHPDIKLSWGKVEIEITTHSEGALTDKDFDLASQIDEIN